MSEIVKIMLSEEELLKGEVFRCLNFVLMFGKSLSFYFLMLVNDDNDARNVFSSFGCMVNELLDKELCLIIV